MRTPILYLALAASLAAPACLHFSESEPRYDSGLDGLALRSIQPKVVVPGTALELEGRRFVGEELGETRVVLSGTVTSGGSAREVEVTVSPRFVDFDHLRVDVDQDLLERLGGRGSFRGTARVEIESYVDFATHSSGELPVELSLHRELTPSLERVENDRGLLFVNDRILLDGAGLLLGGAEGTTYAVVEGCFQPEEGEACEPIAPVEVPVTPEDRFERSRGHFPFLPAIAGIRAGRFEGTVSLENRHAAGAIRAGGSAEVAYDLEETTLFALDPAEASLGQYVEVVGGGFVGGESGATLLGLRGEFVPDDGGRPRPLDLVLVPEFVEGERVRYLLNEDDALGSVVDLREESGVLRGQLEPIVSYRDDELVGDSMPVELRLAPVKQVVYLNFTQSYVASLRHYGLRALDQRIRRRVVEVVERDYRTINVEVRTEPPEDFALYSQVDIAGPDPNGLGLLGYDNTPGKDVGNRRLHDRIGGVNATTQQDGYPGYGGVFIESLFIFSEFPGELAPASTAGTAAFDAIFDPLRPDRGGLPVRAADLGEEVPGLESGASCPASDRTGEIACAVYVLGNLIGSTVSHEIGHSLGLANPDGGEVHHPSDAPNRLMDLGANRPFLERAELEGQGPARFCDESYRYLRAILPTPAPEDAAGRPNCS